MVSLRRAFGPCLALWVLLVAAAPAPPARAQVIRLGGLPQPLPLFPPDNWWNVDVSAAPVDANSANFLAFVGSSQGMHPDFGGDEEPGNPSNPNIYGMPYATVSATQPLVPVTFVLYGSQSDAGAPGLVGYPIPEAATTEARWVEGGPPATQAGGDRHLLLVDRDRRILYELYNARWNAGLARWEAGSGAVFLLDSNQRRPDTWTSADAAGLAILPGLVRHDEAFGPDPIRHAFRVTVEATRSYVFPASHDATTSSNPNALPLGARLRLRDSVDISGYPAYVRKIFQAMKTYGLIVADNGSNLYVQGQYDTRWDNDVLNPAFADLTAADFEVIQLGWQPAAVTDPAARRFRPLAPCRLLDTRLAYGPLGGPAVFPQSQRVVVAAGACGIPSSARTLSLNVTIIPQASGELSLFAGDRVPTMTTTIVSTAGRTRANNAIVHLAASGSGALAMINRSDGPMDVVIDVNGYFE